MVKVQAYAGFCCAVTMVGLLIPSNKTITNAYIHAQVDMLRPGLLGSFQAYGDKYCLGPSAVASPGGGYNNRNLYE